MTEPLEEDLPAMEDLRPDRVTKGGDINAPNGLELHIELDTPAAKIGSRAYPSVRSGAELAVTVCVTGPENETIFRGVVPADTTPLKEGGDRLFFTFEKEGTYTFLTSVGTTRGCPEPVHRTTVEVAR
jgi:hypothetical protein